MCVLKWNKRDSFQKKNTNLLHYAIQLVCILKSNKMDRFQKNPIDDNMLLNSCAKWIERGSFPKTHKLLLYAIQLVCVLKWNKRDSFQKKNKKKQQFITVCYSTCVHIQLKSNKMDRFQKNPIDDNMLLNSCAKWNKRGSFPKTHKLLLYAIQLVCVLKWNKRDSFQKKTTPIYYIMLFNLCAYWNQTRWTDFKKIQLMTICYWTRVRNESRGAVFQKHTNYYCMLFNLWAYWNETRGIVFKKNKKTNLLQYAIQLVCILKWNKRDSFQKKIKKHQFITVYYSTRGAVFRKQQFITVWYSTRVRIEMKQEGQFSKKKDTNLLQYAIQLVCIFEMKQEGRFSKKSNWWKYATELVCEMKQEGQFTKNNNLLLYAIQLVCVLKWNKRDSFQKKKYTNLLQYAIQQEGQFSKNNNLLLYAIQLMCVLKWNKRDSFQQKKTPIYYIMLFNLCAYWNQTRWTDFKKIQLMTICYWTRVRNESRGAVFQKHTNYYCMLFNLCVYWNETRGAVYKKQQFITAWYSTRVRIEMKQEGQFKKKPSIYYSMLFNKRGSFQKNPIDDNMILNLCTKWNKRGSFQKTTIYYCMLFNLCAYWNETRGIVFKKTTKTPIY